MVETVPTAEREILLQKIHGLSALVFLYNTDPERFETELQIANQGLSQAIDLAFESQMEQEVLSHIGPILLSSLMPLIPQESALTTYVHTIVELEPESAPVGVAELVSRFDNVFVVLGKKASGKGTVSELMIQEYGVEGFATSDWLRAIARVRNLLEPYNPIMLREIGNELRSQFGGDVLVWLTLQEFYTKGVRNVMFDGLRSEDELINLTHAITIWIDAPDELRLARILGRARPGDPATIEELTAVDGRSFPEADDLRQRSKLLINNGTDDMDGLRRQVQKIMRCADVSSVARIVG